MEECAEVQKECSKAWRFGLEDCDPRDEVPTTNREKLNNEVNDFLGVIRLLQNSGIIDEPDEDKITEKMERVIKHMR